MQKISQLEPIKRGYNELVCITPRMLTEAEELEFQARETEIADTDENKTRKKYEIYLDFIAEAAVQADLEIKDKGIVKTVPLYEKAETPQDALRKYFADFTPENEKVVFWLYLDIRKQFVPNASF